VTAVTKTAPAEVGEFKPESMTTLLSQALNDGVAVEKLEKIVGLYERLGDRAAAQEFSASLARFQEKCPPIPKSSTAKIVTKGGSSWAYKYAEIDQIARIVNPLLGAEGLSYGWDSVIEANVLTCTCTLRHANGHSVSARFQCPLEATDRMSGAQKSAAALTYARRQSLIQVLGLSTTDEDDDAVPRAEPITEQQAADLVALADEVKVPVLKVCKAAHVEKVSEILATEYPKIVRALEARRGAAK